MMNMLRVSPKIRVLEKTAYRCSICGSYTRVIPCNFIPAWTRIGNDFENKIPLCEKCKLKRSEEFIELGHLQYLPTSYVKELMEFYKPYSMYIRKYVFDFGEFRTEGRLDINKSILILKSYDVYIESNNL